jgi:hypothetical protein
MKAGGVAIRLCSRRRDGEDRDSDEQTEHERQNVGRGR